MINNETQEAGISQQLDEWLPVVGDSSFRIWSSPLMEDLDVVWARDHFHYYPPHIHDCLEFTWIHNGQGSVVCRGQHYDFEPGDIFMVAPNELHSAHIRNKESCTFTMLHVPSHFYWSLIHDYVRAGRRDMLEPVRIFSAQQMDTYIIDFLEVLLNTSCQKKTSNLLIKLIENALVLPQRFPGLQPDMTFWHPAVVHARETLANTANDPINITDIASDVGLNVRYFISLFKDGTGLSPHQYQIALRVERARSLIQGSQTPLSEVAVTTGFSDQSHLNRHFKRGYGYTPGGFRQIMCPI